MKILYINHYAGSPRHGMEFRPYYLAKEWVLKEHDVNILAASVSHIRANSPQIASTFTHESIDGIRYTWCKTPTYSKNGLKRFVNMLAFTARIFQYSFQLNQSTKPDVVIASSTYPLDIFPAYYIAKKYKAKLIFEVHDLWPLSPIELGGMSRKHPFIIIMQFAEDFAYKHSDIIVSMLPKTLEYMESRGLAHHKFHYIPNGIVLKEWLSPKAPESQNALQILKKVNQCKEKNLFTIAYLGTHGLANCLENLLTAAEILKEEAVHFFLIGPGPEKDHLKKIALEKKLSNISFFDSIPKYEVPSITGLFDANYIGLKKESLFRFGISPNKLMDYMAAKKPIINAVEAGNDPVKEAQCGLSVPAENPLELANAIKALMKKSPLEIETMGINGFNFVSSEHDYQKLASNFIQVMKK